MPASEDHKEYLKHALHIARTAGQTILAAFNTRSSLHIDLKNDNDADLVTQVDRSVEAAIFSYLRAQYPSHRFVGEEGTAASGDTNTGIVANDETPTWVVDPVDGTTNFVHGFPFVAVSIAVVIRGTPVVGVVYNPIMNEMFQGLLNGGSSMNDIALPLPPVRPLKSLASALVATEYGSDRGSEVLDAKFAALRDVVGSPARGVRSLGSASLTMCYVARGALDAYWEAGVHAWDVAGATVILREAGGLVSNWSKPDSSAAEPYDICARNVVCVRKTAEELHAKAILESIRTTLRPVGYTRD
ncbi:inositol-phosphate phosphatase [Powellomyces hirtus]|uniref:Inositol-1-monophosphatase n=1 Tax=Powellomyces hirtus TaxID=109895 RepID=A0A507EDZ3_9FUNG|nr:inositol-phosphate phosphatase [Powellomyces hirtus]